MVPGSLANFSFPFSSVIVVDSGNSFLNAAAVGFSESVAENAWSLILIVMLLLMDLLRSALCAGSALGQEEADMSVKMSVAIDPYLIIRNFREQRSRQL